MTEIAIALAAVAGIVVGFALLGWLCWLVWQTGLVAHEAASRDRDHPPEDIQ